MEVWMDIIGYEGFYKVSNIGRIMSCRRYINTGKNNEKGFWRDDKILAPLTRFGYSVINLYKENKIQVKKIHRLVAKSFIPNPENKPQVNHMNGVKNDNRVENLEWVTNSENQLHSFKVLNRKPTWKGKKCSQ